jgi:UDP-glucose:(heptosyl)LPS alpha-1,3-glucosyltransferase
LADRVTFVGTVADLVPYYAAADAYVHPTYYDPCSLVLLEAAASGLPIVTTRRHNGAAELFREGHEILTISDPSNGEALYEQIDALFNAGLRTNLGAAAREVAMRHPFERNVLEILQLYDRPGRRRLAA